MEYVANVVEIHRFGQMILHAMVQGTLHVLFECACRKRDDGKARRVGMARRPDGGCGFESVHDGHLDVHEDQVDGARVRALERAHGLGARGCRQDLGTRHGQHLGGYLAVELVVFGDDDAPAGEIVRNSVAVRSGPRGERIVARGGPFGD